MQGRDEDARNLQALAFGSTPKVVGTDLASTVTYVFQAEVPIAGW